MDHHLVYTYMKEKVKIKTILLYSSMEEDIVVVQIYNKHYKIVIKEVLENMVQLKMFNHSMEIIEEYFHKTLYKILFFMIGLRYLPYIVMVQNILEVDQVLFHIKIEYYILED